MVVNDPFKFHTIISPASAVLTSAIILIRISGPESFQVIQKLTQNKIKRKPRYAQLLNFYIEGDLLDQGIVTFFPSPDSYTGEDMIEVSCHGSVVIVEKIIQFNLQQGVKLAEAGEFTKRSFLNGKLDLIQAQSVIDIIESKNYYQIKALQKNLQGQLSIQLNFITEKLKQLRILLEANIDFSTEDVLATNRQELENSIQKVIDLFNVLQHKTRENQLLKSCFTILIAGKVNAGKSSIFNLLTQQNKAIVTEFAGTTRDLIDHTIYLDLIPVKFIDSAGIRFTQDKIEEIGIQKVKQTIQDVDYIFWVNDLSDSDQNFIEEISQNIPKFKHPKIILIHNKCDLLKQKSCILDTSHNFLAEIQMSTKESSSVEILKQVLFKQLQLSEEEETFFINEIQSQIFKQANDYLKLAYYEVKENDFIELASENIKLSLESLQMLIGNYSNDQLLGDIFSKFCIGK